MKGKLANINLAEGAGFSNGTWAAALPLSNLTDLRMWGAPARCEDPTDLAKSKLDVTLTRSAAVSMVAILYHNLSINAKVRITLAGSAGFASPANSPVWESIWPRMFPSTSLPWRTSSWWTGRPDLSDIDLYPRHLWLPFDDALLANQIRIEIDDTGNPDGFIDLGFLFVAETFSPQWNFDFGRSLSLSNRDLIDETPSGRRIINQRAARRVHSLDYSNLSNAEVMRIFDMGKHNGSAKPILFIPDQDDRPNLYREAFPASLIDLPGAGFGLATLNATTLKLEEILA